MKKALQGIGFLALVLLVAFGARLLTPSRTRPAAPVPAAVQPAAKVSPAGTSSSPDAPAPGAAASNAVVDLAAANAAGGHLMSRHIGQTEAQLAERLAKEPKISAASSFTSRAAAEESVSTAIQANQERIARWLAGSGERLVLSRRLGREIGITLSRGEKRAAPASSVRLVLVRDSKSAAGYRLLTGYPTSDTAQR